MKEKKSWTKESPKKFIYKTDTTDQHENPRHIHDWLLYLDGPMHNEEVASNITADSTVLISPNPKHKTRVLRSIEIEISTQTNGMTLKDMSYQAIEHLRPSITNQSRSPSFVEDGLISEAAEIPPSAPVPQRLPTPDLPEIGMEYMWECC